MAFLKRHYPIVLASIGTLGSLAVYSRLPDSLAVHWDLDGNPNGWMPRVMGAFFGLVFLVVLGQLMRLAPRINPRAPRGTPLPAAYETIIASALLLVLACHGIVLAVALGAPVPISRVVPAFAGALFIALGIAMPRLQPNWWYGIRTPWTLSDDRVWVRTHRLAGYSMTFAGCAMVLAALALPASLGMPVVLGAVVAAVTGPAVYSYLTWRRVQSQ
jgi:uncharacterized membrane protein